METFSYWIKRLVTIATALLATCRAADEIEASALTMAAARSLAKIH